MGVIILLLIIFHSAYAFPVSVTKTTGFCLPFLQGLLPASRWHLDSLSANGTPGSVMSYASHVPIFHFLPLPCCRRPSTTKDVDVITKSDN